MGVESVTGIWDLNTLFPLASDDRTSSDDHHRLIKSAILQTFPNISATISVSSAEINHLDGVNSNINTKMNSFSATIAVMAAKINTLSASIAALSSTLSVIDTQLEELSSAVGNIYSGDIQSGGLDGAQWPTGWTVVANSAGVYTVTTNLGASNPVIQVTPRTADFVPSLSDISANGFTVRLIRISTQSRTDAPVYVTLHNVT